MAAVVPPTLPTSADQAGHAVVGKKAEEKMTSNIDKQKYADDLRARMAKVNLVYRKLWKKYRAVVTEIADEHYKQREKK